MSRAKSEECLLPLDYDELDFLKTAYILGNSICNKATYLRMGAVLVRPHHAGLQIVGNGTDMPRRGSLNDARCYDEPRLRESYIIEAPLVAIDNTRRGGTTVKGTKLYTPGMPSTTSLQALVENKLIELITHADFNTEARRIDSNWNRRYNNGLEFLKQTKLNYRELTGTLSTKLRPVTTYFKGQEYEV
jgi:hypothetical protein